jgi:hypothetical protein
LNNPAKRVETLPTVTVDDVTPVVSLNAADGMLLVDDPCDPLAAVVVVELLFVDEQPVTAPPRTSTASAAAADGRWRDMIPRRVTILTMLSPSSVSSPTDDSPASRCRPHRH